jgi:hypothetical protein
MIDNEQSESAIQIRHFDWFRHCRNCGKAGEFRIVEIGCIVVRLECPHCRLQRLEPRGQ